MDGKYDTEIRRRTEIGPDAFQHLSTKIRERFMSVELLFNIILYGSGLWGILRKQKCGGE